MGSHKVDDIYERIPMRPGHTVEQDWAYIDSHMTTDGFEYSLNFNRETWVPESNIMTPVRRRFWRRITKLTEPTAISEDTYSPVPPPPPPAQSYIKSCGKVCYACAA